MAGHAPHAAASKGSRHSLIKEVKQPKIAAPLQVQLLIAIGRGYSDAALRGLQEVQERLAGAGFNYPPLRVASAAL